LQDAMQAALYCKEIREDDMEFMMSARGWQECIALGNMEGYRVRFEDTAQFFQNRFGEAAVIGKQMIEMITRKTTLPPGATLVPVSRFTPEVTKPSISS